MISTPPPPPSLVEAALLLPFNADNRAHSKWMTSPRWGRVQETAGEDPVLVSEYGVALVAGVVGAGPTMMAAAAPKHFSCYSGPENWNGIMRWTFDAVVPDKFLTSYYHPAWEVRSCQDETLPHHFLRLC